MLSRRVARRIVVGSCVGSALFAATCCGGYYYQLHAANGALQSVALPPHTAPNPQSRILVFAPHCDDETLGVGGLMADARKSGASVKVVLLTNGDGFPLATSKQYLKLRPSAETYVDFAYHRQGETRAALDQLGLKKDQVLFLGYPDAGLGAMWSRNWDETDLYHSPYTKHSRSPYTNSFRPKAPFCGDAVWRDVMAILEREKPTHIYIPHPGDDHPDHWATHCFLASALEELACGPEAQTGWLNKAQVFTFLVHRGDWPVPQGLHPAARLVPPASLYQLDTQWQSFGLSADAVERKRQAIAAYASQTAVMNRFLTSFVRRDEMFGRLSPASPVGVTPAQVSQAGLLAEWGKDMVVIRDSSSDTLMRDLEPRGDVQELDAAEDEKSIHFRLRVRAPLSSRIKYRLLLRPLGCRDTAMTGRPHEITFRGYECSDPRVRFAYVGDELRLAVPKASLGWPQRVFVGLDTRIGSVGIDRICWRTLILRNGQATVAEG